MGMWWTPPEKGFLCPPGLGCLLPSSSIYPKVPKSLCLSSSLIPRLPSCNGYTVGDVWTPSDIAVCFSCLCSPGALVWPPALRGVNSVSGGGLRQEPHPWVPHHLCNVFSGPGLWVPRAGMEGSAGDTRPRQEEKVLAEDLDKSQPCETSRNVYLPRGEF